MEKKSQVTIFIIIALVILGIILFFSLAYNNISFNTKIDPNVEPIYLFVQDCIHSTGEDAIILAGKGGGYISQINLSTKDGNPFYLYNDKNTMPEKAKIEKELSVYIEKNIGPCIDNFKKFPDFQIQPGVMQVRTSITNYTAEFYADYPLSIKKGQNTYELKNFESSVSVRLGLIYNTIKEYMIDQMKNKKEVCISCIHSLALSKDLYFELKDYDSKTVIFSIFDEKSKLKGKEYNFIFANNYNIKENEIV